MNWSIQSPGKNPIKHAWDYLKRRLARVETPPTTLDELLIALQEAYVAISQEFIDGLIKSMLN